MSEPFDISNAAILATLSVSRWNNTKQSRKTTAKVILERALGKTSGKWMQNLLDPEYIEPLLRSGRDLYDYHVAHTLPYNDNGTRILLAGFQEEYARRMTEMCEKDRERIGSALLTYDEQIDKARTIHGESFDAGMYPNLEGFVAKFSVTLKYDPVPSSNHFSNQLAKGHLSQMQAQYQAREQEIIKRAQADAWRQLMDPVQHIVATLEKDDPIIRDTLLGNVTEILGRIDAINLTGDRQLTEFAAAVKERIAGIDVNSLRRSAKARVNAGTAAKELINQFGQLGQRRLVA